MNLSSWHSSGAFSWTCLVYDKTSYVQKDVWETLTVDSACPYYAQHRDEKTRTQNVDICRDCEQLVCTVTDMWGRKARSRRLMCKLIKVAKQGVANQLVPDKCWRFMEYCVLVPVSKRKRMDVLHNTPI